MEVVISNEEKKLPLGGAIIHKYTKELVAAGHLTEDQLILAKASEENLGLDLGNILVQRNFISEEDLLGFLSEKSGFHFTNLENEMVIDQEVLRVFPLHLAKKHGILPYRKTSETEVVVLMNDPLNSAALQEIKNYYQTEEVLPELGSPQRIHFLLDKHHQQSGGIDTSKISHVEISTQATDDVQAEFEANKIKEIASGPKVISAVNNIIVGAKKEGASDIHIEPFRENVRVRYRVDGVLRERGVLPRSMHMPIVSRIKIMGGLDIAERRIPQDGRARVSLFGKPLDLRISTCPTQFGEKIVMRLFVRDNVKTVDSIGFDEANKKLFVDIITKPNGIFLVTGPTGSGKSSTLYAGLMRLNSPETNIITIEDPVETEIDGVNQVSINPKAGLTFASVLRSTLRQDPDVIMIGEIRDGETGQIAVRAAITGHMVLSTLHTNTAIGAIGRLKDIGIEPFMLASSLKGILAQRLVRKICEHCKEEGPVENEFEIPLQKAFYGKGCEECSYSGYSGRLPIFELIEVNKDVRHMIHQNADEDDIDKYYREHGVPNMMQAGIMKVEEGLTTIQEVLRVTIED